MELKTLIETQSIIGLDELATKQLLIEKQSIIYQTPHFPSR